MRTPSMRPCSMPMDEASIATLTAPAWRHAATARRCTASTSGVARLPGSACPSGSVCAQRTDGAARVCSACVERTAPSHCTDEVLPLVPVDGDHRQGRPRGRSYQASAKDPQLAAQAPPPPAAAHRMPGTSDGVSRGPSTRLARRAATRLLYIEKSVAGAPAAGDEHVACGYFARDPGAQIGPRRDVGTQPCYDAVRIGRSRDGYISSNPACGVHLVPAPQACHHGGFEWSVRVLYIHKPQGAADDGGKHRGRHRATIVAPGLGARRW